MDGMEDYYMVEEMLCYEGLRGARLVSPLFCEFSLDVVVLGCFVFCCVCWVALVFSSENSASN